MVREIPLGGKRGYGKYALVDDEDFDRVIQHSWYLSCRGYALTTIKTKCVSLHRLILDFPDGIVDHINHEKLLNTRANLRVCTPMESTWNRDVTSRSSTGYRGVYLVKSVNKYQADIMANGERITLGYFYDKDDAAKARDIAAMEYFGEYACLNLPDFDYTDYEPVPDMKEPTSVYPGINYNNRSKRWTVRIQHNNKRVLIGEYNTEELAAKIQDFYAIQNNIPRKLNFPEYNYTNFQLPPKRRFKYK